MDNYFTFEVTNKASGFVLTKTPVLFVRTKLLPKLLTNFFFLTLLFQVIYDEVYKTWWSVDNRRLFVFKKLKEMGYVNDIFVRDISETQVRRRDSG